MPVMFDDLSGGFVIRSDYCDCGEPFYDTGCDARGCSGQCCMDCGTGCDIEFAPENGECATSLAEETPEEYDARLDRERRAFGFTS